VDKGGLDFGYEMEENMVLLGKNYYAFFDGKD